MTRLSILGAGSWGTALAIVLAPKFDRVTLWAHERELVDRMCANRENDVFLPGFSLAANVEPTTELSGDADLVLGVMPSQHARSVYSRLVTSAPIVSATKGIEQGTLFRVSEIIATLHPGVPVAVLSGPTFAREVAAGLPTALVVASRDTALAERVQTAFSSPRFRLYTNSDVTGVEIAASLKNVIAIAAGVVEGLKLGSNTQAALITRGLAEITRLAVAAGGEARTLAGLAGLGDLVLTCNGALSRNRRVGLQLAEGKPLAEITASTPMVAEGVETASAALALAAKLGVEVPITAALEGVLTGRTQPADAIRSLMERSLKGE